jgi:hypothetical protein
MAIGEPCRWHPEGTKTKHQIFNIYERKRELGSFKFSFRCSRSAMNRFGGGISYSLGFDFFNRNFIIFNLLVFSITYDTRKGLRSSNAK